ncbi:MAG: DUF3375 family protein [Opitutus sp.]
MSFTLADLRRFVEASAGVRLLRGGDSVETLAFLFSVFRTLGEVVISESELRTRMLRWLEVNFSEDPATQPDWTPADRIAFWVKQTYLRKREPLESAEPVYELTSDIDRLLSWLEDQRRREFVGTEYGLQAIIRDLRSLSARASGDWQKRLDDLKSRRAELDREIGALLGAETEQPVDLRFVTETLQRLERSSQDLVGDFSLLRERFSDLARDIARQQSEPTTRRGDTLRLALDGEDALRKTPMGESFYGFWRMVASSERDDFVDMVETIYATSGLSEELRQRRTLMSLLDRLREQGQVVLDANRQLTRQLRRALDREEVETRRLMSAKTGELRLLLLGHMAQLVGMEGLEVDERVDVRLPMERPLYDPPEPVVVETHFAEGSFADAMEAARQIAAAGLVDYRRLVRSVQQCLDESGSRTGVLLSSVVERFPPMEGILDILGYLHIGRLLGDDAEVMTKSLFHWTTASGRRAACPDVFFVSVSKYFS